MLCVNERSTSREASDQYSRLVKDRDVPLHLVECFQQLLTDRTDSWGVLWAVEGMKRHATAFSVPTRSRAAKKLQDHLPKLNVCDAA